MRLGFETAALDAKRLAAHALNLSDLQLATQEHDPVSPDGAERLANLVQRRLAGESVGRILGEREFYGLPFRLNSATLEPRPETELLVDHAIKALSPGGLMLDLGTGTGCIPIAVLANRPDARAFAVDLSPEALDAARENANRNGVADRITFFEGSWFDPLPEASPFQLIVSNPPYIASTVIPTLSPEVRHNDPVLALDGGADGLDAYRIIVTEAPRWLVPGGQILLEIGFDQGAAIRQLLHHAGFSDVAIHRDLNGLDRVASAHHMEASLSQSEPRRI
jgi:release factor glutamine methyltransferase